MLDGARVRELIANNKLGSGMEHEVGVLKTWGRVIKDYDTSEGSPFFPRFKKVSCLFDYLTDHMLANCLFGDDVQMEGCYEEADSLHVVVSQPFIKGKHLGSEELIQKLEKQGFASQGGSEFIFDAGRAGTMVVTDLHEDNALLHLKTRHLHIIDVHFAFSSQAARIKAMRVLGIYGNGED